MKRLNPHTGKPFVSGEAREDGKVFYQYIFKLGSDGFFKEKWSSVDTYNKKALWRIDKKSTKTGHIELILNSIKHRAKEKNIEYDLDVEYILSISPEVCPALNIKLAWCEFLKKAKYNSPSIDRINPKLGYVKGNVQVISNRANTIKQDATLDELKNLVRHLETL